jgi:hypothetical protein
VHYYRCNKCNFAIDIDYIERAYVLEDGRQVDMDQQHVWCSKCGTVTPAERLEPERREADPTIEAYYRQQAERQEQLLAGTLEGATENDVRYAQRLEKEMNDHNAAYQLWKTLRTRPSFCLICGNEAIWMPPSSCSNLPHPNCGGELTWSFDVTFGTHVSPVPHQYTPDGEFLKLGHTRAITIGDQEKPLELFWSEESTGDYHRRMDAWEQYNRMQTPGPSTNPKTAPRSPPAPS